MATALALKNPGTLLAGPLGSLDAYLDQVGRISVLSREEEQALAKRLREENDVEAARQLVLSHLRFVVHIARGYLGYGLPMGDLIQEGNVGLMKAVKRFDPGVGVRAPQDLAVGHAGEVHVVAVNGPTGDFIDAVVTNRPGADDFEWFGAHLAAP